MATKKKKKKGFPGNLGQLVSGQQALANERSEVKSMTPAQALKDERAEGRRR